MTICEDERQFVPKSGQEWVTPLALATGRFNVSHPHFYSAMATWGRTFECSVLVHEADREWITDQDACIQPWQGDQTALLPGVTQIDSAGISREYRATLGRSTDIASGRYGSRHARS